MSVPLLTDCPLCGQAEFKKQLTAAGFQLKGTGWYVTDFREGGAKNSAPAVDAKSDAGESVATTPATAAITPTTPASAPTTTTSSTTATAPKPAASTAAPSA
jgi:hypothetical protein